MGRSSLKRFLSIRCEWSPVPDTAWDAWGDTFGRELLDGFFRVEKAELCMKAGRRCCRWWNSLSKCGESQGDQTGGHSGELFPHGRGSQCLWRSWHWAPVCLGFRCIPLYQSLSSWVRIPTWKCPRAFPCPLSSEKHSALQSILAFATYSWGCLGPISIWASFSPRHSRELDKALTSSSLPIPWYEPNTGEIPERGVNMQIHFGEQLCALSC